MTDTPITIVGNLASDPELRFTPSGAAVANFRVLSTPRRFDKTTNDWKDGETLGITCSVWREAAENLAQSLHKGDRVIVTGELVARSWQTNEGENRTVMEIQAEEVGPSLRYATAQVVKAQRQGNQGGNRPAQPAQQQTDPWNQGTGAGGWGQPNTAEAPF